MQRNPGFVERLKNSPHTISYHVRPPHPVNFPPTAHYLDTYSLADYETYRLDLRTGDPDRTRPGGYDYVAQTFGRNPSAVGLGALTPALQAEYAAVLAAGGARMGVFEHQSQGVSGFESLHHPEQGLYPRPADYFLARTDAAGHANDNGSFWWKRVSDGQLSSEALAASLYQDFLSAPAGVEAPRVGIVVIQENDFYSNGTPWAPVYYADAQGTQPLNPPWCCRPALISTRVNPTPSAGGSKAAGREVSPWP